ncbi:tyrosine-type recombinase/integrase [Enterococcus sp. AD013-P3]|uniref:tyrosine-type recombinase/integrase n=1 Tax=Enterococcus sp. AD013-P3 TaxID=3411036 RepID=UPI003B960820
MSVYKYKSAKGRNGYMWRASIYVGKDAPKITKAGFRTKSEAQEYESTIRRDMGRIRDSTRFKMTVGEAYDLMVKNKLERGEISKSTVDNYKISFNKIFDYRYVNLLLVDITYERLQKWLDEIVKTVSGQREFAFLKLFFKYCYMRNWILIDPSVDLFINKTIKKTPKAQEKADRLAKKMNWLEGDDYTKFMTCLQDWDVDPQDRAIVKLGLGTGLRKGEIRALTVADVDFDKRRVNVSKQLNKYNEVAELKGAGIKHQVPLSTELIAELKEFLSIKKAKYESKGWKYSDDTYLFNSRTADMAIGKEYIVEVLNKFYRNFKDENINRITVHGMRHTFASQLYHNSAMNLYDISLLMGHSNVQTTIKYYIHTFDTAYDALETKLYKSNS